ncbi:calpain-8-like isoform X2 [Dendropsophus ebraccatus]
MMSLITNNVGTLENPRKFLNQDFKKLRQYHLTRGERFTDESFPANKKSIGWRLKKDFNVNSIEWKRPTEKCNNPQLIVDGTSQFDIIQNNLGDCWLLSAIAAVTVNPEVLKNLMPPDQGFSKDYAGIFHFRLWHLGQWHDVVIDDKLPFLKGEYMSTQPPGGNEFWPCLLEKAYAKLLGSYEALDGGLTGDAFMNLTGGLPMTFELQSPEAPTYWNMISSASEDAVMACSIFSKDKRFKERTGLGHGHAYSITNHTEVPYKGGKSGTVRLLQVRNPWGDKDGEWINAWSDRSLLWNELEEEDRERLQKIGDDGQFWICWEDFMREFSNITICNQVPDFLDWRDQNKKWQRIMVPGEWTTYNIAWDFSVEDIIVKNPQYDITVTESGDEGRTNVVISLMQSSRNRQKFGHWLPISFVLYELPDTSTYISKPPSEYTLDITEKYNLPPGRYGIVPFTEQEEHESSFLLQVFLKSFPEDSAQMDANNGAD